MQSHTGKAAYEIEPTPITYLHVLAHAIAEPHSCTVWLPKTTYHDRGIPILKDPLNFKARGYIRDIQLLSLIAYKWSSNKRGISILKDPLS